MINFSLNDKCKIKEIKTFFIDLIYENIKNIEKKNQKASKSKYIIELLFIDILVCLFLTKHFISAFFNIEKLNSFKSVKSSLISRIRLKLLELDIIKRFNQENNKSINKTFIELYKDYCEFDYHNKLLEKNEICFKNIKIINEKIAKLNNYSNNLCMINSKKNDAIYNFQEFAKDLEKLQESLKSCHLLAEKVLRNRNEYDNILIKNLLIYYKFFEGYKNDIKKTRNSMNKNYKTNFLNNMIINQEEKHDFEENTNLKILDGKVEKNNPIDFQTEEENIKILNKEEFLNDIHEILDRKSDKEKIILKQTKEGSLIFEKITANFSESLNYKTKEIIGKDLNYLLPEMLIELHHSHVVHFLKDNYTLVKNKEIYFISKKGYCINFYISGTIILTLDEEVIIYVEVTKVIKDNEKMHEGAFLSCDLAGEIIAYDEGIFNHLLIDNNVISILKPNFFKTFLDISNQNFDFGKEKMSFEFDYHYILNNLKTIDYSKLIDFKNKDDDSFWNYSAKLDNTINFVNDGKIMIKLTKRNLLKKFYFYDCRLDFSKIRRFDIKMDLPKEYYVYYKRNNTKYKHSALNAYLNEKEKKLFCHFMDTIKGLTIFFKSDLNNLEENMKIIKIFTDNYIEEEDPVICLEVYKNFKIFKENNKFEYDETDVDIWINFKNRVMTFFIIIVLFILFYAFITNLNHSSYDESKIFINFSYSSLMIKTEYISIANSFLSIFFLKNKVENEIIDFSIIKNNQIIEYSFNNSIEYHINLIHMRANNFLDDFYNFNYINFIRFIYNVFLLFLEEFNYKNF